jgi:hypothetical protein
VDRLGVLRRGARPGGRPLAPGGPARALPRRGHHPLRLALVDRGAGEPGAGRVGPGRGRLLGPLAPRRPGQCRSGGRRAVAPRPPGTDLQARGDPSPAHARRLLVGPAGSPGRARGGARGHRSLRGRRPDRRSPPRRRGAGRADSLGTAPGERLRPLGRRPVGSGPSRCRRGDRFVRQDLDQAPPGPPAGRLPGGGGQPGLVQQPGRTRPGGQRAPGRRFGGLRGRDGHVRAGGDPRSLRVVPA